MDPFARKMIFGALGFGSAMLLMAGALAVVYFHLRPQCSEQVLAEAISPDNKWIAAAMERRCGDDKPFLLHVNLRPAQQPVRLGYFSGRATEGEIFLAEEDTLAETPDLEWNSPEQLHVRCGRCSSASAQALQESWQTLHIRYDTGR